MSCDIDTFLDLPRLSGLVLSADATRLVVSVTRPGPDGKRMRTALWELDPEGQAPARQLTRSRKGEAAARFLPDGDLLFVSPRADPDAEEDSDEPTPGLWSLPAAGGEANLIAAPPAGVAAVAVARDAGTVVATVPVHPAAASWAEDEEREKARKDAGVTAQLFTTYPIRHWDDWLGPREPRLWRRPDADAETDATWTDLTPESTGRLWDTDYDLTPDGGTVVTAWHATTGDLRERPTNLVAIGSATGGAAGPARRRLLVSPDRVQPRRLPGRGRPRIARLP